MGRRRRDPEPSGPHRSAAARDQNDSSDHTCSRFDATKAVTILTVSSLFGAIEKERKKKELKAKHFCIFLCAGFALPRSHDDGDPVQAALLDHRRHVVEGH